KGEGDRRARPPEVALAGNGLSLGEHEHIAVAANHLLQLLLNGSWIGSRLKPHDAEINVGEWIGERKRFADDPGEGAIAEDDGAVAAEVEAEVEPADQREFAAREFGLHSRFEEAVHSFAGHA